MPEEGTTSKRIVHAIGGKARCTDAAHFLPKLPGRAGLSCRAGLIEPVSPGLTAQKFRANISSRDTNSWMRLRGVLAADDPSLPAASRWSLSHSLRACARSSNALLDSALPASSRRLLICDRMPTDKWRGANFMVADCREAPEARRNTNAKAEREYPDARTELDMIREAMLRS